jgi:hypothetical protein
MKLDSDDKIWFPVDKPDYLCVLTGRQHPPQNQLEFLSRQRELLDRLVEQSNQAELDNANRMLSQDLSARELDFLPSGLFHDPKMSRLLLEKPCDLNGPLHQWKEGFNQVRQLPQMSRQEAKEEAEGLSLESFLSRLL